MSIAENPNPEEPQEQEENAPQDGMDENSRIAALEVELQESKDRMMRALADAENTRKRALKDREDAGKYAVSRFAKDLLDFADNFQRALGAIPEDLKDTDARLNNVIEGLQAMEREMLKVFEKNGVKKIEPLDEKFDPNFHEVMFETPIPGKEAGIVIQVVESGYVLHDRLLRPARVGIAKQAENETGPQSDGPGSQIDQEA